MAQTLQIKKVNTRPSTFEKGTIYFNPSQKEILLGLGSGSTEGTHYVVFKGTDTDNNTNVNGGTTTAKRYLLGTSSTANTSSTNTNANCYMQSGALYSNGSQVLTSASAVAGSNINSVGTPSVEVSTSNGTSTFTFNYLKGATGASGSNGADGTDGYNILYSTAGPTGTGTNVALIKSVITNNSSLKVGDLILCANGYLYQAMNVTSTTVVGSFLCTLRGAKGNDGASGADGADGADGANGQSIFYSSLTPANTVITILMNNIVTTYKTPASGDFILCANGFLFGITSVTSVACSVSYLTSLKGADGADGTTASVFSTDANGLVPKSTNENGYLKGDGTWNIIPSHNVSVYAAAPLSLQVANSTSTEGDVITSSISGSISTAGAATLGVVQGFHRTSGTAVVSTRNTSATDSPTINGRSTVTGRYYGVETDSAGKMFVNVPWANTAVTVAQVTSSSEAFYISGPTALRDPAESSTLKATSGVYVTGTSNQIYASGGFYESSDERLKDFENDLNIDFDKLKSIKKAYFHWKSDPEKLNIGISAQSIQQLYPEVVTEDINGMLSVSYDKLAVIALVAVDSLDDRCKILEKKNKELEERLGKLEILINKLN